MTGWQICMLPFLLVFMLVFFSMTKMSNIADDCFLFEFVSI